MRIADRRSEFAIFVVDADFSVSDGHAQALRALGYQAAAFSDIQAALIAAHANPPHAVIFNFERLEQQADIFLEGLRAISDEILTIALISSSQTLVGVQLVSTGKAYECLRLPMATTLELTQAIDRACERLYFQFALEVEATPTTAPAVHEEFSAGEAAGLARLAEFHSAASEICDNESLIELFIKSLGHRLGNAPALYFRWQLQRLTLSVTQCAWMPIERLRGVGISLASEGCERAVEMLKDPQSMTSIQSLMSEAFRVDRFVALPHLLDGQPVGAIVLFADVRSGPAFAALKVMRQIFESAFKQNVLIRERHAFDRRDQATGLLSRRSFAEQVESEIARARRISLPVSLLCLRIDPSSRLTEAGQPAFDTALRTIAKALTQSARVNDVHGRTATDEIMILLPHADERGAAARAERARRTIASLRIAGITGPVTVSIGVAVYPVMACDADSLLCVADEALAQATASGGNKICLSSAHDGFQPDFSVDRAPDFTPGLAPGGAP